MVSKSTLLLTRLNNFGKRFSTREILVRPKVFCLVVLLRETLCDWKLRCRFTVTRLTKPPRYSRRTLAGFANLARVISSDVSGWRSRRNTELLDDSSGLK